MKAVRPNNSGRAYSIAVLGLGHVGLPTALGLASLGWQVVGADEDGEKVRLIHAGKTPFFEPSLDDLLARSLAGGKFRATYDVAEAIRSSSVVFVCVGTPQMDDGAADLSQVELIARTIGRNLNGYKLIVEKSTVPAITALWIKRTVQRWACAQWSPESDRLAGQTAASPPEPSTALFDVASNPEFLQEGRAVENVFHPDRVIIGVESERAREILEAIYRPLKCPLVVTDVTTAELIKHAANAFLSTRISFINMVADVCDAVGADVTMVAKGMGLDPRIGPGFLQAGIGFGGYCFPKDLRAFIHLAEEQGVDCSLLRAVERINQQRVEVFLKKLRDSLWVLRGKTIGVLGLAFKPDTDDIREAPSLRIVDALIRENAAVRVYDPCAMPAVERAHPEIAQGVTCCDSAYEVARGAEAVLLLTEWEEFKHLDLSRLRDLMAVPLLVDGRNIYNPETVREAGFEYVCVGRGSLKAGFPSFPLPEGFATAGTAAIAKSEAQLNG